MKKTETTKFLSVRQWDIIGTIFAIAANINKIASVIRLFSEPHLEQISVLACVVWTLSSFVGTIKAWDFSLRSSALQAGLSFIMDLIVLIFAISQLDSAYPPQMWLF